MSLNQTFQEIIRDVSSLLGDLELGELTSVSNSMVAADTGRTESDGHWTGGTLAVNGEEQTITNWTKAGGVFTTNAFKGDRLAEDEYELRKLEGHQRDAVKRFINMGIRDFANVSWAQLDSREDLLDTTYFDLTNNVWQYTVPDGLDYVHKVLWQYDPSTISTPDTMWYELEARHWHVNQPGSIVIHRLENAIDDGDWAGIPDKAYLKFLGSRKPRELTGEKQRIDTDSPYPMLFATARMCLVLSKGVGKDDWKDQFTIFYKDALQARDRDRKPLPSGSRKVR